MSVMGSISAFFVCAFFFGLYRPNFRHSSFFFFVICRYIKIKCFFVIGFGMTQFFFLFFPSLSYFCRLFVTVDVTED